MDRYRVELKAVADVLPVGEARWTMDAGTIGVCELTAADLAGAETLVLGPYLQETPARADAAMSNGLDSVRGGLAAKAELVDWGPVDRCRVDFWMSVEVAREGRKLWDYDLGSLMGSYEFSLEGGEVGEPVPADSFGEPRVYEDAMYGMIRGIAMARTREYLDDDRRRPFPDSDWHAEVGGVLISMHRKR